MKRIRKILVVFLLMFSMVTFTGCQLGNIGSIIDSINNQNGSNLSTNVQSVLISGDTRVAIGETITLTATIYPVTASQDVAWTSNDESIATVDNGVVTGVNIGSAVIRATSTKSDSVYGVYTVRVVAGSAEPTAIEIVGEDEVFIGNSLNLSINVTPNNAKRDVTWSVNDTSLATIDSEGKLEALKEGTVTVSATYNAQIFDTKEIVIKVNTTVPQKITVKGYSYLYVGEVATLDITTLPATASKTYTFTSSDPDVASVDSSGRVKGLSIGTTTITVASTLNADILTAYEITVKEAVTLSDIQASTLENRANLISKYASKSIFGVVNYTYDNSSNEYSRSSIGTGFVYSAWAVLRDGNTVEDPSTIEDLNTVSKYCYYMISNRHVVKDAAKIQIYIAEYDKYIDATVQNYDDKIDVAVIYFEHNDYITPLEFGDSTALESGDYIYAIGNPEGLEYYDSITDGIVSSPIRYYSVDTDSDGTNDWDQEYIQHTAAINPGNSGGPLINSSGQVVGINTMKFASDDIDNMGFSIPYNNFAGIIEILEKGQKPQRAVLGVTILDLSNAVDGKLYTSQTSYVIIPEGINYGLYVSTVVEGGVAASAGVKPDDIILSIDGVDLIQSHQVRLVLGKFIVGSGDTTTIEVYRDNQVVTLTVTF